MSSDEIRRTPVTDMSSTAWMKEIAYQLALLNESQPKPLPYHMRKAKKA